MLYHNKPKDFDSLFEIASCFVEHNKEILLLNRQDHKPQGNTWGVPAGKIDEGETPLQTMIREIKEETGFKISDHQIFYFDKLFVKYPDYDFVYYMFHTKLEQKEKVRIRSTEHKAFQWISPEQALAEQLIPDLDGCIRLFYNIK